MPTGISLMTFRRAEQAWDDAVNKIRVDKPPAPELTSALARFATFVSSTARAIENAGEAAEDRRFTAPEAVHLRSEAARGDEEYVTLKDACDAFFAMHGHNPDDLST